MGGLPDMTAPYHSKNIVINSLCVSVCFTWKWLVIGKSWKLTHEICLRVGRQCWTFFEGFCYNFLLVLREINRKLLIRDIKDWKSVEGREYRQLENLLSSYEHRKQNINGDHRKNIESYPLQPNIGNRISIFLTSH